MTETACLPRQNSTVTTVKQLQRVEIEMNPFKRIYESETSNENLNLIINSPSFELLTDCFILLLKIPYFYNKSEFVYDNMRSIDNDIIYKRYYTCY